MTGRVTGTRERNHNLVTPRVEIALARLASHVRLHTIVALDNLARGPMPLPIGRDVPPLEPRYPSRHHMTAG